MPNDSKHADVVIIGGGVMGMSAAYHLARRARAPRYGQVCVSPAHA